MSAAGVRPRRRRPWQTTTWPGWIGSSWLLGVIAAVLSWSVVVQNPGLGLDPSWAAALYMGAHRGLHAGTQMVFTYGPLGFLDSPGVWYGGLGWLAFIYSAVLYLALGVSLVWALRRTVPGVVALLAAVLILLAGSPSVEVPITLATLWCLIALGPQAPDWASPLVAIGGAALGAIECLVLLRSGPVVLIVVAITLLATRPGWRWALASVAVALLCFFAAWFASGQTLGNLSSYVTGGWQIISGYGEAMGEQASSSLLVVAVVVIAVIVVALAVLSSGPGPARLAGGLVMAVALFALLKEAVVRADDDHLAVFYAGVPVLAAAVLFRGRPRLSLAVPLVLVVVALVLPRGQSAPTINPVQHLKWASDGISTLINPGHEQRRARRGLLFFYRLDPQTIALLRGHTVDILPWEEEVAWDLDLHWQPLPVFQDYSAYTARLDRLNATGLTSADAPQRLLRENPPAIVPTVPVDIDSRLPAWDPPAQNLAMLCHYAAVRSTPYWQVLARVPARCGTPRLLGSVPVENGRAVSLPPQPPGAVLLARIHGAGVSGSERVRTTLYRARFRWVRINGGRRVRLVPGTAGDGLILDIPPQLDFPAPFALSPQARTLAFQGLGGPARIDIYAMPLTAVRRPPP